MKKLSIALIAASCMLSASAMADDAQCQIDQQQMIAQINTYGSITSNGYQDFYPVQITEVDSAWQSSDPTVCLGEDFGDGYMLGWADGNWGNTLLAKSISSAAGSLRSSASSAKPLIAAVKTHGTATVMHVVKK